MWGYIVLSTQTQGIIQDIVWIRLEGFACNSIRLYLFISLPWTVSQLFVYFSAAVIYEHIICNVRNNLSVFC